MKEFDFEKSVEFKLGVVNEEYPHGKSILQAMKEIGNSNQTFNTKNILFNELYERIGFELEIYKGMTGQPIAAWNANNGIVPVGKEALSSKKTKKTDLSGETKHFRVAIRLVEPYFKLRLVSCKILFDQNKIDFYFQRRKKWCHF